MILFAMCKFTHIVLRVKVVSRTDHQPLIFLQAGSEHSQKLARWWVAPQEFDYTIEYVKGKSNEVPDCLSQLTTSEADTEEGTLEMARAIHAFARRLSASEAMQDELCVECETALDDSVLQCTGCCVKVHE